MRLDITDEAATVSHGSRTVRSGNRGGEAGIKRRDRAHGGGEGEGAIHRARDKSGITGAAKAVMTVEERLARHSALSSDSYPARLAGQMVGRPLQSYKLIVARRSVVDLLLFSHYDGKARTWRSLTTLRPTFRT